MLLLCGNDGAVLRGGRAQITVPGGHDEVWILDRDGRCEMDCVVAAQRVPFGEFACGSCEGGVEADHVQLIAQLIDASDRAPKGACVDPPASMRRCCCCCARFGVDQLAGGYGFCAIPQLCGNVRTGLVKDELDQCGSVEVDDQRRCSATRSDTGAEAASRLRP